MLPGIYWLHKVFSRHSEGCPFQYSQTICLQKEGLLKGNVSVTLSDPQDLLYGALNYSRKTHLIGNKSYLTLEKFTLRFNESFILTTKIKVEWHLKFTWHKEVGLCKELTEFWRGHVNKRKDLIYNNVSAGDLKEQFLLTENRGEGLAYHNGQTWVTAHSSHEDAAGICPAWWHVAPPHYCSPSLRQATLQLGSSPEKRSRLKQVIVLEFPEDMLPLTTRYCFFWEYYLNNEGDQDYLR